VRRPVYLSTLANTGWFAYVPPAVVAVILPALLLAVGAVGLQQLTMVFVEKCSTFLIPGLAAWWPAFACKERIEGEGRELLYFLRRGGAGVELLAMSLTYVALTVPFIAVSAGDGWITFGSALVLGSRCLFVATLTFCAAYLLSSSALALVIALLFSMVAMVPLEAAVTSFVAKGEAAVSAGAAAEIIAGYCVVAGLLLAVGSLRSRRFE